MTRDRSGRATSKAKATAKRVRPQADYVPAGKLAPLDGHAVLLDRVAQLEERYPDTVEVAGSTPVSITRPGTPGGQSIMEGPQGRLGMGP